MITILTPKIGAPVPDQENAAGLLKPLLFVAVKDEKDNWDTEASAILANDGVSVLVKRLCDGKNDTAGAGFVVPDSLASSLSRSQPRHPGHGGASS